MSNRVEQVRAIQAAASLKAADLAVKKREAKERNQVLASSVVATIAKKRKCSCC